MKDKNGHKLSNLEVVKKASNRLQNVLLEFEILILHWIGHVPLHHVRRFFYRIAGIKIGKGSTIHTGTRFYDPRNISIGNDSIIGEGAVLDGRDILLIGDHVDIASDVMIYNSSHDIYSEDFHSVNGRVVIGDYVFIGPRAIILPGVSIGKGAAVGAGAVVTKNVPDGEIVGGVSATAIGVRNTQHLTYKLGRARWFR